MSLKGINFIGTNNSVWIFFCILATLVNDYFHTLLTYCGSTQNFTLTKDELGVTRVQDISSQDMEKVRSLSLIELTALFDSHGLALHRRKPVKRRVRGMLHQVGLILTAAMLKTLCKLFGDSHDFFG